MERLTRKHFRPGNTIKLIKESVLLKMYDKLYELEDAEEQGLLLRLPCRVGDEVFVLDNRHKIIHPFEVKNIHLNKYELNFRISYTGTESCLQYWEIGCCNSKLGETVFLTKEEAEQALARMEGEHE